MPGATYRTPWEARTLLDMLPNLPEAKDQLGTVYTLTCYQYGRRDEPARVSR
jgi:hypothetical protein